MATPIYIQNFKAESRLEGNSVLLTWTYPSGFDSSIHECQIVRKQRVFPEEITDGTVILITDSQTSFIDTGLRDVTYYYYTAFIAMKDGSDYFFLPENQTYALSVKKYGYGEVLWNEVPEIFRVKDQEINGELRSILDAWGAQIDLFKSEVKAFGYIRAGVESSPETLPALVNSLGLPQADSLPIDVLRRAALHLVYIYKRKGTAPGIIQAIKLLTGWDSFTQEARTTIFKSWDGQSQAEFGFSDVVAPGLVVDLTKNWLDNQWAGSIFIDHNRKRYTIRSNDRNTISLTQGATPVFTSLSGNASLSNIAPGAVTSASPLNANEYQSFILVDSEGKYQRIKTNDSSKIYFTDPFIRIAQGPYKIKPFYEIMAGDHTLTYDDYDPLTMKGGEYDPFSQTFATATRATATAVRDTDILLTIQKTAKASGVSTYLNSNTLTNIQANWTPDEFVGMKLNPNSLQTAEFTVASNTSDTLTIEEQGIDLVSEAGDRYFIISKRDSVKLKRLRELLPNFIAAFARPVLFFEPLERG